MIPRLLLVIWTCVAPEWLGAETLRVATFDTELSRDGPGLLLRDIRREDPQVLAVAEIVAAAAPDVVLLQSIDWDHDERAVRALRNVIRQHGLDLPHIYAPRSNRGEITGLDLNGDGRLGDPEDAQGFGHFTGDNAMALLSRYPIDVAGAEDGNGFLWRDLPEALLPEHSNGAPFPSVEALEIQRLSTSGHWRVPVFLPDGGRVEILAYHATPPVFDGPEDRNGRRNHDETRFWSLYLSGDLGGPPPAPFVLLGNANLDPERGDGRSEAIVELLRHPALKDPAPDAPETSTATVDWSEIGLGFMRVSYAIPSADLSVVDAGVIWPSKGDLRTVVETASRHRLVWVDLRLP